MRQVESNTEPRKFSPEEIAAVVKVMRTERGWSQEVLADLCRIDVRTIQRVESSAGVGEGSLRAIARAFGYEDIDFFNKPHRVPTQDELDAAQKRFDEAHLLLDVVLVTSGRDLGAAFSQCSMDTSNPAIELEPAAAEEFARLIDYLRDFRDIARDMGEVEKLGCYEEIEAILTRLRASGIDVCYATRETKLTSQQWADKTPWPVTIMYCSAFTRGKVPGKMAVPRQARF